MPSSRIQATVSPLVRSMIDETAACLRVACFQRRVERQALERAVVARQREAHDGAAVGKREAACIAWAEGDGLEALRVKVHEAELAGAGVQKPQLAVVHPRRMRHGEPFEHAPVVAGFDEDAAIGALVAPAVRHVGGRDRGDEHRRALPHRHAVQVAAVLRRELGDEGRAPQRLEARAVARCRDAGEERIDEHGAAAGIERDVMDIEVARDPRHARHIDRFSGGATWPAREDAVEAIELIVARKQQRAGIVAHREPHAARKACARERSASRRACSPTRNSLPAWYVVNARLPPERASHSVNPREAVSANFSSRVFRHRERKSHTELCSVRSATQGARITRSAKQLHGERPRFD